MKRNQLEPKRLVLMKERIRVLAPQQLRAADGGTRLADTTTNPQSTKPVCYEVLE